jgi:hypothetical protein
MFCFYKEGYTELNTLLFLRVCIIGTPKTIYTILGVFITYIAAKLNQKPMHIK